MPDLAQRDARRAVFWDVLNSMYDHAELLQRLADRAAKRSWDEAALWQERACVSLERCETVRKALEELAPRVDGSGGTEAPAHRG
jgi:hypothetical protein